MLKDPKDTLRRLCEALAVPYTDAMLRWPAGRRDTDGVWAPAWYDAVERSTGFGPPPRSRQGRLPDDLRRLADAARPHYEHLAKHRLSP